MKLIRFEKIYVYFYGVILRQSYIEFLQEESNASHWTSIRIRYFIIVSMYVCTVICKFKSPKNIVLVILFPRYKYIMSYNCMDFK